MGAEDLQPAHELLLAVLWRYQSQPRQQQPDLAPASACLESAIESLTTTAAAAPAAAC